jgi:hypothetical protein
MGKRQLAVVSASPAKKSRVTKSSSSALQPGTWATIEPAMSVVFQHFAATFSNGTPFSGQTQNCLMQFLGFRQSLVTMSWSSRSLHNLFKEEVQDKGFSLSIYIKWLNTDQLYLNSSIPNLKHLGAFVSAVYKGPTHTSMYLGPNVHSLSAVMVDELASPELLSQYSQTELASLKN